MPAEHRAVLNLGCGVEAVRVLPAAVALLREHCRVRAVSTAIETEAVGSDGPNFVNVGVEVATDLDAAVFKEQVARGIEATLGRVRAPDSSDDRGLDIDIVLFDGEVLKPGVWGEAFVLVPTAELAPELTDPVTGQPLAEVAAQARARVWMVERPDVAAGGRAG